jgi:hypothetical protein
MPVGESFGETMTYNERYLERLADIQRDTETWTADQLRGLIVHNELAKERYYRVLHNALPVIEDAYFEAYSTNNKPLYDRLAPSIRSIHEIFHPSSATK